MNERILFVDDDPNVLEAYQRKLQHVLRVRTAEGPHLGLREVTEKGPFAVVVADMNMPVMNGIEFLEKVQKISPDTVRIMLTGNSDVNIIMNAVNKGQIFRFLVKPCPSKLMATSLADAINQYRLVVAEKELLEGTLKGSVELLAEVLSWVNPDAFGKTVQLRNVSLAVASRLGVGDTWELEIAATLSQIGLMALPQDIIAKVSQQVELSRAEQEILESVPEIGHNLLKGIPRLENVAAIVYLQQKHFDGDGFPKDNISGENIPLGARILKAVSDFQILRSKGVTREECAREMASREGWYDPRVLSAMHITYVTDEKPEETERVILCRLRDISPGQTLASSIETLDGRKLVQAKTQLSGALLVRLKKFAEINGIKEPVEILVSS